MNVTYNDYLETGTRIIMEFLSSSETDYDEQEKVISAFSDNLIDNICHTEKLENAEVLLYGISLQYNDERLTRALSNFSADYCDYEKEIKRCGRVRAILQMFIINGWTMPKLNISDFSECENTLRKRFNAKLVGNKIVELDKKIEKKIKAVEKEPNVNNCDEILGLLNDLTKYIDDCQKNDYPIPKISIYDTELEKNNIQELRIVAKKKDELYKKIFEHDTQIKNLIAVPHVPKSAWNQIIGLCQQQKELLMTCSRNNYPIPDIKYSNPQEIEKKYVHFKKMLDIDVAISSERKSLTNETEYETFFENCEKQEQNIRTCKKNWWSIPELTNSAPRLLEEEVQIEKEKKDKIKKLKMGFIMASAGILVLFVLVLLGIGKYRQVRTQIPFDDSYCAGKKLAVICRELNEAGFTDIQMIQDTTGWCESNEVLSVSIDNKTIYQKGKYIKPDVKVIITYSSSGRVNATSLLGDWRGKDYLSVCNILNLAGFTNVKTTVIDTLDKDKDGLISSLTLNNILYNDECCWLPKEAPIIISYYTFKISIDNTNADFIGQDYLEVMSALEIKGFTNIVAEQINTGWAVGNSVVCVTINDTDAYDNTQLFDPCASIVVKYSSNDREDATNIMNTWGMQNYKVLQETLEAEGFCNVTVKERVTNDKTINQRVVGVMIGNETYKNGDCFIQRDAAITIEYFMLKITAEKSADACTTNTKGKYVDIVEFFADRGFTNIKVMRNNSLVTGWVTKEGSIASISIDGNDAFKATDSFYYDAPVIIVVNTFANKGCDDITEILQ